MHYRAYGVMVDPAPFPQAKMVHTEVKFSFYFENKMFLLFLSLLILAMFIYNSMKR
jgi:hypothetical protein